MLADRGMAALEAGRAADAARDLGEAWDIAKGEGLSPAARAALQGRLARAHLAAGDADAAREAAVEVQRLLGEGATLPEALQEEIHYVLGTALGAEAAAHLERAKELVAKRAANLRDTVVRDHYLRRTWPARELLGELGGTRTM